MTSDTKEMTALVPSVGADGRRSDQSNYKHSISNSEEEINDNFEVFLVKSDKQSLEIEADDNLHEIINRDFFLLFVYFSRSGF